MLETVREYALERLEQRGEADALRGRHAVYYRALAEQAEPELDGPRRAAWYDRLERELDNVRAALAWLTACGAGGAAAAQEACAWPGRSLRCGWGGIPARAAGGWPRSWPCRRRAGAPWRAPRGSAPRGSSPSCRGSS